MLLVLTMTNLRFDYGNSFSNFYLNVEVLKVKKEEIEMAPYGFEPKCDARTVLPCFSRGLT